MKKQAIPIELDDADADMAIDWATRSDNDPLAIAYQTSIHMVGMIDWLRCGKSFSAFADKYGVKHLPDSVVNALEEFAYDLRDILGNEIVDRLTSDEAETSSHR